MYSRSKLIGPPCRLPYSDPSLGRKVLEGSAREPTRQVPHYVIGSQEEQLKVTRRTDASQIGKKSTSMTPGAFTAVMPSEALSTRARYSSSIEATLCP